MKPSSKSLISLQMRPEGFEPSRVSPQDPKSCASASSATVASGSNNNRYVIVVAGFPTGNNALVRFDTELVSGRS